MQLPVRTWDGCSPEGYLTTPDESERAPAPEGLDDPQAFYTQAPTYSMLPAGVWPGDHCLVSPCAQLRADRLMWLRHHADREAIRLLIRITAATYEVLAWEMPDEKGHQAPAESLTPLVGSTQPSADPSLDRPARSDSARTQSPSRRRSLEQVGAR